MDTLRLREKLGRVLLPAVGVTAGAIAAHVRVTKPGQHITDTTATALVMATIQMLIEDGRLILVERDNVEVRHE